MAHFWSLALRQAADKLPTTMEFITRSTPPRLGNLVLHTANPERSDRPLLVVESAKAQDAVQ